MTSQIIRSSKQKFRSQFLVTPNDSSKQLDVGKPLFGELPALTKQPCVATLPVKLAERWGPGGRSRTLLQSAHFLLWLWLLAGCRPQTALGVWYDTAREAQRGSGSSGKSPSVKTLRVALHLLFVSYYLCVWPKHEGVKPHLAFLYHVAVSW